MCGMNVSGLRSCPLLETPGRIASGTAWNRITKIACLFHEFLSFTRHNRDSIYKISTKESRSTEEPFHEILCAKFEAPIMEGCRTSRDLVNSGSVVVLVG